MREPYARRRGPIGTGRCWCKAPTNGAVTCEAHRRAFNHYQESRRLSASAGGQCQECGAQSNGKSRCPECVLWRAGRPSRQQSYRRAHERKGAA